MIRIFLISMFSLSLMAQENLSDVKQEKTSDVKQEKEKASNDDPMMREFRKVLISNKLSSPLKQADLIVFKEACQFYNVTSSENTETANSATSQGQVKIRIQQNQLGLPDILMNYGEVAKGFKKLSETFKNAFGKEEISNVARGSVFQYNEQDKNKKYTEKETETKEKKIIASKDIYFSQLIKRINGADKQQLAVVREVPQADTSGTLTTAYYIEIAQYNPDLTNESENKSIFSKRFESTTKVLGKYNGEQEGTQDEFGDDNYSQYQAIQYIICQKGETKSKK